MNTKDKRRIGTLNTNGLKSKLRPLIGEINKSKCMIFCFQELHRVEKYQVIEIEREGKGKLFINQGTEHSTGVGIFIKERNGLEILENIERDIQGRFIRVEIKINGTEVTIISIYCPGPGCSKVSLRLTVR